MSAGSSGNDSGEETFSNAQTTLQAPPAHHSSAQEDSAAPPTTVPDPDLVANHVPAPTPSVLAAPPPLRRAQTTLDDQTLASLAASSSSSLPMHSSAENSEIDDVSPSFLLVASLRSQITDLTSQVTSLNSKLVNAYTRHGDLEDEVHEREEEAGRLKEKVKALERDREGWEKEIERGGWVERENVQTEMKGLMSRLLEETANRESAVQAHGELETEIDNLTSSLFTEANRMVAVERYSRALAEEKMKSLEQSGKDMSGLLDELQASLREKVEGLEKCEEEVKVLKARLNGGETANGDDQEREVTAEGAVLFSDGSTVTSGNGVHSTSSPHHAPPTPRIQRQLVVSPQLLTTALPYHEFLSFLSYLRQLRLTVLTRPTEPLPSTRTSFSAALSAATQSHHSSNLAAVTAANGGRPPTPTQLLTPYLSLSQHLAQPFLKRCIEEDSDPTLRLDLAPGLGFISRRNVGTAILDGTLLIEPSYAGASVPSKTCALCGTGLEQFWVGGIAGAGGQGIEGSVKPNVNTTMRKVLGSGSWSIASFTSSSSRRHNDTSTSSWTASSSTNSGPPSPSQLPSSTPNGAPSQDVPFSFPTILPPHQQIHIFRINDTTTNRYAICPTYCLPRLRAVCEFWNYVRNVQRLLLLENGLQSHGREKSDRKPEVPEKEAAREKEVVVDEEKVVEKVETESEKVEVAEVALAPATDAKQDCGTAHTPTQEHPQPTSLVVEESLPVATSGDSTPSIEPNSATSSTANLVPGSPSLATDVPTSSSSSSLPLTSPSSSSPSGISTNSIVPPRPPRRNSPAHLASTLPPPSPHPTSTPVVPSPLTAAPTTSSPPLPARPGPTLISTPTQSHSTEATTSNTGWEDKCWNEVVRLKESIFWTRVAAVGEEGKTVDSREARVV